MILFSGLKNPCAFFFAQFSFNPSLSLPASCASSDLANACYNLAVVLVELLSAVWLAAGSTPGPPVHHHLPELAQTHVHWVGDAIQPSPLLSSPSPPVFCLSQRQSFSSEWARLISWLKYWSWSFSFSISPFSAYAGLISFRMDWFDILAVQGALKSLLQQHRSKASVLWCSAFFMVQLSHHTWLLEKP